MHRIIRVVFIVFITGLLAGCFSGDGKSGGSSQDSEFRFSLTGVHITGLSATLNITGMGTYPMTLNVDDTVSTTIAGITPGWHTFTLTYSAGGVTIADVSQFVEIITGQNVVIAFTPTQLNRNFDDDFDGWVNMAEIQWGSDPILASSYPIGEDPYFVQAAAGGVEQSITYILYATVGEGFTSDTATSFGYSLQSGFTAYP